MQREQQMQRERQKQSIRGPGRGGRVPLRWRQKQGWPGRIRHWEPLKGVLRERAAWVRGLLWQGVSVRGEEGEHSAAQRAQQQQQVGCAGLPAATVLIIWPGKNRSARKPREQPAGPQPGGECNAGRGQGKLAVGMQGAL